MLQFSKVFQIHDPIWFLVKTFLFFFFKHQRLYHCWTIATDLWFYALTTFQNHLWKDTAVTQRHLPFILLQVRIKQAQIIFIKRKDKKKNRSSIKKQHQKIENHFVGKVSQSNSQVNPCLLQINKGSLTKKIFVGSSQSYTQFECLEKQLQTTSKLTVFFLFLIPMCASRPRWRAKILADPAFDFDNQN